MAPCVDLNMEGWAEAKLKEKSCSKRYKLKSMDTTENNKSTERSPNDYGMVDSLHCGEATISRRKFIAGSAALGVGIIGLGAGYRFRHQLGDITRRLLAQNHTDSSADRKSSDARQSHNPVPNTIAVKAYREFLDQHPLQYLSPDEILSPHFKTRAGVQS